jgi:plasmid stabilization system protein ParE
LIQYTERAEQQLDALRQHYLDRERLDALRNLEAALDEAEARIERNPAAGLAAPHPYPFLAKPGRAWVKARRYWISYLTTIPPLITGIFYDTADIPSRA